MDQWNYRLRTSPYNFRFGGLFQLLRLFLPQSFKESSATTVRPSFFAVIAATFPRCGVGVFGIDVFAPVSGVIDLLNLKAADRPLRHQHLTQLISRSDPTLARFAVLRQPFRPES